MDKLRAYFVDENNAYNSPYYELDFKNRSDKLRISLPHDPVAGSVYIMYQLFTNDESDDSFSHHYSLMQLLAYNQNYLQLYLMAKPLAQFAVLVLFKLGYVDMKPRTCEEIYACPGTAECRLLALKIIQKLVLLADFLPRGFGFVSREIEWYTEPMRVFYYALDDSIFNLHHVLDKTMHYINYSQFDVCQFIDQRLVDNIGTERASILGISSVSAEFLFSAQDFAEILIATMGDPTYAVALEAVRTLRMLLEVSPTQTANLLFSNHLQVYLVDVFCARVAYPHYYPFYSCCTEYYESMMQLCGDLLQNHMCVSAMAQSGLIKTLAALCEHPYLTLDAAECLLQAAISAGQAVSAFVAECCPALPLIILNNLQEQNAEPGLRLCAILLQNNVICHYFADNIDQFFDACKYKQFAAQGVLQIINKAAKIPRAQVRINAWLKETGELYKWIRASYYPETSEILIKQEFLRNEQVLDAKINQPRGAAK